MPDPTPLPAFQPDDIARFLATTRLAPRQPHKLLTVWPLLGESPDAATQAPPYVALADAIAERTLRVREMHGGGSVGQIVAENRGDVAVLVLFGEELRGAKQNRIANASFLVGRKSRVVLDVSCVEQGRWAQRSTYFAASGEVFSSSSRRKMARLVKLARAAGRRFEANQQAVWWDVAESLERSQTRSRSAAYADHLRSRASELDEAAAAFHALPHQVGFVAAIGDQMVGLEAVGRPEVFARVFRGLMRSFLVDALDSRRGSESLPGSGDPTAGAGSGSSGFDAPEPFVRAVASATATAGPSLGLGEDVRLAGAGTTGCALFAGSLVHVTAFPEPPQTKQA